MESSGTSRHGSPSGRGDGLRGRAPASASLSLLVAIALAVLSPAAATVSSGHRLRGRGPSPRRIWVEAAPDVVEGIDGEIAMVEGEILELENQEGDDAAIEAGVLESVEEELIEMRYDAPDAGTLEEETLEEIAELGEEIEELDDLEGADAELKKVTLASVEQELIRTGLPPDCNLKCFFDNHQDLAGKVKHTKKAVEKHFQGQKIPQEIWEHACDCQGETAVMEEMIQVEEEIENLEGQEGEDAKLQKEALESVEMGFQKVLAPGCDLDCLFKKYSTLGKSIDHTEEALLDFLRKRKQDRLPSNSCGCQVAGGGSAVEEGARDEIAQVQEEIEALELQGGAGAKLQAQVLALVEEDLVRAALPPGCDMDCFFANHAQQAKQASGKVAHTKDSLVDMFRKQKGKIGAHACDCH